MPTQAILTPNQTTPSKKSSPEPLTDHNHECIPANLYSSAVCIHDGNVLGPTGPTSSETDSNQLLHPIGLATIKSENREEGSMMFDL
eukprot:864930-Ditylum_brightwellii.AAC.1